MIRSPKSLAEWSEFTPRVWTKELEESELESSCVVLKRKRDRRMMIKLTGGTAAFQIEVGRWQGVERKERTCKECQSEEVEDVCHWSLQCSDWDHLRGPLVEEVSQCDGFQGQSLTKQAALVLATACANHTLLNYLRQSHGQTRANCVQYAF